MIAPMTDTCREGEGTGPLDPMVKWCAATFAALFLGFAPIAVAAAEPFTAYSDTANAAADIAAAIETAKVQNKRVLVIFGANWCPDCRALDGMAHTGPFAATLARSYIVVHADVGRFNKNLELASRFGLDAKRGIPAIVVASAEHGTLEVADGRVMDKLMKGGADTLADHFTVRD